MTLARLRRAAELRWHAVRRPVPVGEREPDRLARLFQDLNARHFEGRLPALPIRLSARMRRRLGQLSLARATGRPYEIVIGRRHLELHGWGEVAHTLLHEMVHLWQWQSGLPINHGASFRARAREVGIHPAAVRRVHDVLRTPPARARAVSPAS